MSDTKKMRHIWKSVKGGVARCQRQGCPAVKYQKHPTKPGKVLMALDEGCRGKAKARRNKNVS